MRSRRKGGRSSALCGASTLSRMHVVGPIIGDVVTPESDSSSPVWWIVIGIGIALIIAGAARTLVRRSRRPGP